MVLKNQLRWKILNAEVTQGYTLRVLKNAEPNIAGQKNAESRFLSLYSNEHSYSQIFITHFFRFFSISQSLVTHFFKKN